MARPRKYNSDRPSTPAERKRASRERAAALLDAAIRRLFQTGPVTKPGWSVTLPPARQPFYEFSWEFFRGPGDPSKDPRVIAVECRFLYHHEWWKRYDSKDEYQFEVFSNGRKATPPPSLSRIWRPKAPLAARWVFDQTLWQRWENVVPVSDGLRCTPYHCEPLLPLEKERGPLFPLELERQRELNSKSFPNGEQIDRACCGLCGVTYVTLAEARVLSDMRENILWRPDFPGLMMDRWKRLPKGGSTGKSSRKPNLSDLCQLATSVIQEFDPKMWRRQEDRDVVLPTPQLVDEPLFALPPAFLNLAARIASPAVGENGMSRDGEVSGPRLNWCPKCREYTPQKHEHGFREAVRCRVIRVRVPLSKLLPMCSLCGKPIRAQNCRYCGGDGKPREIAVFRAGA